jgi:manganese efflux pump family protein
MVRQFRYAMQQQLWELPAGKLEKGEDPFEAAKRELEEECGLTADNYIGGKMLLDGIHGEEAEEAAELSAGALFMQGVATSIDALSVGFTISEYGWLMALTAAIIIAVVTFFLCMAGLRIGKKFGTQLSGKASILGGVILIGIGLEIFITGVF